MDSRPLPNPNTVGLAVPHFPVEDTTMPSTAIILLAFPAGQKDNDRGRIQGKVAFNPYIY
jgi:hypothetical protein